MQGSPQPHVKGGFANRPLPHGHRIKECHRVSLQLLTAVGEVLIYITRWKNFETEGC